MRIKWIDTAKGYGILLVIYGHLGIGELWTWIYSFHMPLFFFLSGYVFNTKNSFGVFVSRKISTIVIPYFCLGIPMVLFTVFKNAIKAGVSFSISDALHYMKLLFLQERLWTLWFTACLFFLNILFYFLNKVFAKYWMVLAVSMIMPILGLYYYKLGGTPLFWNIDVCMMAIPFFAIGYLYKLYTEKVDNILEDKLKSVCIFFVCLVLNIISWRLSLAESGAGLEMFQSHYGNAVFTYIAAFAGIGCMIIISKWFIIEPIRYIGEHSMIYYAWHQTIMIPIILYFMTWTGLDFLFSFGGIGVVVHKCICVVGIVFLLTVLNWGIEKSIFKFVLGK